MSSKARIALDSSVLVAAVVAEETGHAASRQLLQKHRALAWSHAGLETFSSLTGGRLTVRMSPAMAAASIANILHPRLEWLELSVAEQQAAMTEASAVGARGGAIYDYLHLVAARKAGATHFYTLNQRHFMALARAGDPQITLPV